jgi:hypothetical protein
MILIDYNAIAIGNVVTQKLDLDENLVRHMILNSLRMYRRKHKAQFGELVICTDGQKNWRYDAFPNYKFKRKGARKASSIDWQELFRLTNMVLDELSENFPYKVVKHENAEADDIIAAVCETTQEFGNHEDVIIISSDKDFAQLQKWSNIKQWSPMKKGYITFNEGSSPTYTGSPKKQLMELILRGDQSDGVPNVLSPDNCFAEGIRQTPLRQKALDQLICDPESMGPEIYRNFLRNKKLIDLSETPDSVKQEIIYNYEQQDKTNNTTQVFPYLVEKRCRMLLESVEDFV